MAKNIKQSSKDLKNTKPNVDHLLKETFLEVTQYPKHLPRHVDPKAATAFKEVHRKRIIENDEPCYICGISNSKLKTSENPSPSEFNEMELHHVWVEFASANSIDPTKWNSQLRPILLKNDLQNLNKSKTSRYSKDFTKEQIEYWSICDTDNLLVLCNVHHRGNLRGIHMIPYPTWILQKFVYDNFELTQLQVDTFEKEAKISQVKTKKTNSRSEK